MFILGKSFSASSPLTDGWTMTSSPVDFVSHLLVVMFHASGLLTRNPVDRSGDAVLVASLEGVDNAQNLGGVAASAGGVGENSADGLLGVDHEDGADGESNALGIDVGSILVVDPVAFVSFHRPRLVRSLPHLHVVGKSDLPLLVTNDGEAKLGAGDLIDVLDPAAVALNSVCAQADELGVPLGELRLELSESAELGGADGGVILGVGEENDPVVANELMEVNGTTGGLSLEVRRGGAEAEGLRTVSHCVL
jgi:hypothetical protein